MEKFFTNLDRRWIFLVMGILVALPMLLGLSFPEEPSDMVRDVFQAIDELPEGSNVLMAYDYDPATKGELEPMAAAFTRHCATKKHKLYFITLWPAAVPMLRQNIDILEKEFGDDYTYGTNYVNLGFRPGNEGVIKVVVTDLQDLYANDVNGEALQDIPMTKNIKNIQQMDLIVNVSAGTPGAKEWVQYAASKYQIKMVAGVTGVGAPALYPYVPAQLTGLVGAIKAAAEYEQTIIDAYPEFADNPACKEALRRMGPQLIAHIYIVVLIILGNVIYFTSKKRGTAR